jgi:hypothetical protein
MCNGTKTNWRCKCISHTCPRRGRDTDPGHDWDTHNYGAYFFCDAYLLADRFSVGHRGIPPCPRGVTTDFETRYRNYLCPDCADAGCPPIDHSLRYEDSTQSITREQREEISKRGRSMSRSRTTGARASSTDTVRPERQSRSRTPTPVTAASGRANLTPGERALQRALFGPATPLRQPRPSFPGASTGVWDAQRIWQESQVDIPGPGALGIFHNALAVDNNVPKSNPGDCSIRPTNDGKFEIEGPDGKMYVVGGRDPEDGSAGSDTELHDVGGPDPEFYDVGGPDLELQPELFGDGDDAGAKKTGVSDARMYALDRYGSEDV